MPNRRAALAVLLAVFVAACGGGSASPSVSAGAPATPGPSVPASTVPTPAASVAPPASPAGDSGGPYAEAMVTALGSDDLMTHIEQSATATVTVNGAEVTVTAELVGDISAQDLAFVISVEGMGVSSVQELRVIGDTAYSRTGDGAWSSAPRAVVADALAGLFDNVRVVEDPHDLRYVGIEEVDGQQLHHLTAARTIPYAPSTGGTGEFSTLDAWVEDDGTPVVIRGVFSAIDGSGNEGSGTSEFRFSMFGEPVLLEVPAVAP